MPVAAYQRPTNSRTGDFTMLRLATMLYSMIATSVAGSFIVAALVMGYDGMIEIIVAAALGAVVSVPASYFIAQAIIKNKR
jgi:preprotein translocase subunit SecF